MRKIDPGARHEHVNREAYGTDQPKSPRVHQTMEAAQSREGAPAAGAVAGASPGLRAGLAAPEPEESPGIPHYTRRETMIAAIYVRKSTE